MNQAPTGPSYDGPVHFDVSAVPVGHVLDWPDLPALQQPHWPDAGALADVLTTLSHYPPLVFAGECDNLRDKLALASQAAMAMDACEQAMIMMTFNDFKCLNSASPSEFTSSRRLGSLYYLSSTIYPPPAGSLGH